VRILDLFSGLGGASSAFVDRGHSVVTLDNAPRFGCTITADILNVTVDDLLGYGPFDFVWASPPCTAFSVASIGHHWGGGHRRYEPKTEAAATGIEIVAHTIRLITGLEPRAWIIENPRGVLRKLPVMDGIERRTVTYCQYGMNHMKPTDLWGGFPSTLELHPPCKNGDPCHESAPRGSKTGVQGIKSSAERALVPYALSLQVCIACEDQIAGKTKPIDRLF